MIACTLIAFFTQVPTASGATSSYPPLARVAVASDTYSGAAARTLLPTQHARSTAAAPEKCPEAKKAIAFYSAKLSSWRVKMGAGVSRAMRESTGESSRHACPHLRRLAHTLQRKAHQQRLAYLNWHYYHYRWDHWLPQLWVAIGECETGLNWHHNSGTYEGAFGFYKGSWDAYKPSGAPSAAYLASPRQQYQAALNIQARVGLNAWGCYSHGGYKYHMR